jgi:membrane-associated phospholipid phosphatase
MKAALAAAAFFAAFIALGAYVSPRPPGPLDANELGFFGVAVGFATFCRAAGQFPEYASLCGVWLVFGLVRRAYLASALWAIGLMLVIWKTSDAFKGVFNRARPERWLATHETSAGYPSGHAVLSLAFYGFLAFVVWRSPLPARVRAALVALCALWIAVIGWSRLALGSHFPSDVLGGYLLGGAGLCAVAGAYVRTSRRDESRTGASERSPW